VVFYGASLFVSTGTLLLAALPAAIAERAGAFPDRRHVGLAVRRRVLLLAGLA
jgi:hypothetical protein